MPDVSPISLPVIEQRAPEAPDESARRRIARELAELIEGEVRFSPHDRMLYATDASIYQVEPIGVVCPKTLQDAVKIVEYCADRRLAVLPRGGGTSLAGQAVNAAVVIDFSPHCGRVLHIDAAWRIARVEPGVILDHLNAELEPHGLIFGPDVASGAQATIGGMIGNNSAGAYSLVYGRTVEHLAGLDVALADGTRLTLDEGAALRDPRVRDLTQRIANVVSPRERQIRSRFPRTVRRVNGYNLDLFLDQLAASAPGAFDRVNLAHLVCGSEGTLAVTLQAQLRLVPAPAMRGLAIIAFAGVDQALEALPAVLHTSPAAVELIDDVVIGMAMRNAEHRRYVDLLPVPPSGTTGAVLYVAYFGETKRQVQDRFGNLQSCFASHAIQRYTDHAQMARAWRLRKAGEPLLHGIPGARKPITFIEDTAVNPQRLADFVREFRALVARHGTTASYYAHASVGCLHIRPLVNIRDAADRRAMQTIMQQAADLVMRYEGALSGEHGDGRLRSPLLERFYGPQIFEAFVAIKKIFDPDNRLNPGIITALQGVEAMLERLRVRPREQFVSAPEIKTHFRYAREHGFGEAVEQCNGAGVCRKMHGGVMCPSYRATLDERHSTRGRGNALRLAITGQLSPDGCAPAWNDAETLRTLDLCLSCKACKSECPSNVDVAKLKAEYLAQSYDAAGRIPLRVKALGHIRAFNRAGSALHPLANALAGLAPVATLARCCLGLHPRRALPRFERSLHRWMAERNGRPRRGNERPVLLLLPDCFTTYNEPHIGQAAVRVLEALGYRIVLPKVGCCGRAMISNGMLRQALTTCRQTAADLLRAKREHEAVAIVGSEPSCVSAIKDEWLDLDLGLSPSEADELARDTFLVEQYIEEHWERHPARPPEPTCEDAGLPILLHGHCHQKALWGIESSAAILRRLFGQRLKVLDTGCCGMAGAFGYTRGHYGLSMRIGELSLFPMLRAQPQAIACAPGTSCRQQIFDALGRRAMHPIEIIAGSMPAPT